jgi:hypothetical protein
MSRSPNTPPGETVRRLATVEARIRRLQRARERLIGDARAERESWQAIAAALGVSRQAAWQACREGAIVVAGNRARSNLSDAKAAGDAVAGPAERGFSPDEELAEARPLPPGLLQIPGEVGDA